MNGFKNFKEKIKERCKNIIFKIKSSLISKEEKSHSDFESFSWAESEWPSEDSFDYEPKFGGMKTADWDKVLSDFIGDHPTDNKIVDDGTLYNNNEQGITVLMTDNNGLEIMLDAKHSFVQTNGENSVVS